MGASGTGAGLAGRSRSGTGGAARVSAAAVDRRAVRITYLLGETYGSYIETKLDGPGGKFRSLRGRAAAAGSAPYRPFTDLLIDRDTASRLGLTAAQIDN